MAFTLSLAHLSLIELAPPALVEAAADAGFTHVGMRLAPALANEAQHPMLGGAPMMAETLARMRDRGVAVHDVEIVGLAGDTAVAQFEPLLAAAAQLGARHLLVAGNSAEEGPLAERFAELCELGRPYGVRMGLEFMPWRGVATLASALRVVEAAGAGGVIVDAIHLDRSGGTAADIARVPRERWSFFQVCDAPAPRPTSQEELLFQARQARLPPGRGGLDLAAMVRALPADSAISIEIPMHGLPGLLPPVARARMLRATTLALLEQAARPPDA